MLARQPTPVRPIAVPSVSRARLPLIALLGVVGPLVAGETPSFTPLGHLGSGTQSLAMGVSADGSVVVGYSRYDATRNTEAFRWTATGGMVGLGGLTGGVVNSRAMGVSADGQVIAGAAEQAFRWTAAGGMEPLGPVPGTCSALGISADGTVIVGWCASLAGNESFRWTQGTGIVILGGLPATILDNFASDASADGSVLCGQSQSGEFNVEPTRWTQATGMVGLGDLPGGQFYALGWAISGDGSVIVGEAISDIGWEAFRWTPDNGLQSLDPNAAAVFSSFARDISADGAVVVGSAEQVGGAALWTERHGFRGIQDILENDGGLDLSGWTLNMAQAISDDKRTVAGYGTNPNGELEAWVARIPPLCTGDTNADFEVNISDLSVVLAQFGQTGATLAGDLNGDLLVDITDLAIVLAAFGDSC